MKMPQKILVIHHWGRLGDAIIFASLFEALKKHCPDTEITWIGSQKAKALHPLLSHVQKAYFVSCSEQADIGQKWTRLLSNIKEAFLLVQKVISLTLQNKYDIVIYSQRMIIFQLLLTPILALLNIPVRIGFENNRLSQRFLTHTIANNSQNDNRYMANRYLKLLEPLINEPLSYTAPHLAVDASTVKTIKERLTPLENPSTKLRIALHPGVGANANNNYQKAWPITSWQSLLEQLLIKYPEASIYLSSGPDDTETIAQLNTFIHQLPLEQQTRIIHLPTLQLSFDEYAAALSLCDLLVVADTGILHLAIGLGIPVVAVFTSTNEKLYTDDTETVSVVTRNDLNCRPCLWIYRQTTCENPVCLNVPIEAVVNAIHHQLEKKRAYCIR